MLLQIGCLMLLLEQPTATSSTATVSAAVEARPEEAAEQPQEDSLFDLEIHAFVSQGVVKSTANNYLGRSERGSLALTEAGLNVSKVLVDRLSRWASAFSPPIA